MYKLNIGLETQHDVVKFVDLATTIPEEVQLCDGAGHCVSGKSLLGCMYSLEFENMYVTSNSPRLSIVFKDFMK